jgi:hypothetical protein
MKSTRVRKATAVEKMGYHGVEKKEDGIGDSGGNAGRTRSTSAKGSTLFFSVSRSTFLGLRIQQRHHSRRGSILLRQ